MKKGFVEMRRRRKDWCVKGDRREGVRLRAKPTTDDARP